MSTLSQEQDAAVERELDRLATSINALGSLQRGQTLRKTDRQLLEQYGFVSNPAHPTLDRAIAWDSSQGINLRPSRHQEPASVAPPVPITTTSGHIGGAFLPNDDDSSAANNPWGEMELGSSSPTPRNLSPTPATPAPTPAAKPREPEGTNSVEDVMSRFDWR